jgi:hypothetical protein
MTRRANLGRVPREPGPIPVAMTVQAADLGDRHKRTTGGRLAHRHPPGHALRRWWEDIRTFRRFASIVYAHDGSAPRCMWCIIGSAAP